VVTVTVDLFFTEEPIYLLLLKIFIFFVGKEGNEGEMEE
jgi:hypothetical protein